MFRLLLDPLLSLLYPQECEVCHAKVERRDDGVACSECWAATRLFTGDEVLCHKCGSFLKGSGSQTGVSCHQCDDHLYDYAAAAGIYEKAIAASIVHLKHTPFLARRVADALLNALRRSGFDRTSMIVPVPLSARRRIERGYNQAEILARIVSKRSGFSCDSLSLVRKLDTPAHRTGMDMKARELTVRNAFEVKRPKLIEGHRILLIDDVFTSGATASYCAKALKKSGAVEVNVLTLARAVMD